MKFKDLDFQNHPNFPNTWIQAKGFFKNWYWYSVVQFPWSYWYEQWLYELAVLKWTAKNSDLCYDTIITNDVEWYLTEEEVVKLINRIEKLKLTK